MIEKATNRELTAAFKAHLGETEKQVQRLEQAFELLGQKPKGTNARRSTASSRRPTRSPARSTTRQVLDAALIAAAQAVEHYEITRYGSLIAWAEELGNDAAAASS